MCKLSPPSHSTFNKVVTSNNRVVGSVQLKVTIESDDSDVTIESDDCDVVLFNRTTLTCYRERAPVFVYGNKNRSDTVFVFSQSLLKKHK